MTTENNSLMLRGLLQIETAKHALEHTGMSEAGAQLLIAYLDLHAMIVDPTEEKQKTAIFFIKGGDTPVIKEAVIESLGIVARTDDSMPHVEAASELLRLLQDVPPTS